MEEWPETPDRYIGLENRQQGNKPYFTRVSLSFSAGNTAATGGNILLPFKNLTMDFRDFTDGLTDHGKPVSQPHRMKKANKI